MTSWRDLATRHAWRGAFAAAALNAVGMSVDWTLARDIPAMPFYPYALSVLVGIGLMGFLLIRRQRATVRLGSAAFLVNTCAILMALWITSGYWATSGTTWSPFQANELGAVTVPMLAPELGIGVASIAGFAATAVAKFYALDPVIQHRLPAGEPWSVLVYALFGGVLLIFRLRGLALERDMLRAQAEAAAAEQLARTFLRLCDYTNTPIQTITFTIDLLRAKDPRLGPALDRLARASRTLAEFSHALTRHRDAHTWSPGEESLEAATKVEQLFGSRNVDRQSPRSSAGELMRRQGRRGRL